MFEGRIQDLVQNLDQNHVPGLTQEPQDGTADDHQEAGASLIASHLVEAELLPGHDLCPSLGQGQNLGPKLDHLEMLLLSNITIE